MSPNQQLRPTDATHDDRSTADTESPPPVFPYDDEARTGASLAVATSDGTACPDCEEPAINVQGVLDCLDCD